MNRDLIRVMDIDTCRFSVIPRGTKSERQVWICDRQSHICVRDRKTRNIVMPALADYNPKIHEHPANFIKGTY